jgi:hypothetical protein
MPHPTWAAAKGGRLSASTTNTQKAQGTARVLATDWSTHLNITNPEGLALPSPHHGRRPRQPCAQHAGLCPSPLAVSGARGERSGARLRGMRHGLGNTWEQTHIRGVPRGKSDLQREPTSLLITALRLRKNRSICLTATPCGHGTRVVDRGERGGKRGVGAGGTRS